MSDKEQFIPETEQPHDDIDMGAGEEWQAQTPADDAISLQAQIEELRTQLLQTQDDALRKLAEAQNIQRRSERDVENARKFALEKFAGDLLGVADNLERALDASDGQNEVIKPLMDGVALTQKSLIDTLAKYNVIQLNPLGEPFDPQYHQAMSMVENPDVEPNTVTLVMQKGYTINERLLRPAMVMVSKASQAAIDEQV